MRRRWVIVAAAGVLAAACSSEGPAGGAREQAPGNAVAKVLKSPVDLYEHDRPGLLGPAVRDLPARVYVPDSEG
ncbi:hypothetical protein ACFYTC_26490, partial [Actinomadura nitritigenes]